jgi:transglutaminase-like putative cysteine protease
MTVFGVGTAIAVNLAPIGTSPRMTWRGRNLLPGSLILMHVGLILACLMKCGFAAPPDNQVTFDQVASTWTVARDGTWVVDAEVTIRAPKDNPSHIVRVPLVWTDTIETLTVIQARVEKPDGRKVIVGGDAIREDSATGDRYFHEFSAQRRLLITYVDIQPGDLLVFHTRRDVIHPRVPGGFMAAVVLDPTVGWTDTNYTISVPSDMPLLTDTRGFEHQSEIRNDRTLHYFRSQKDLPSSREIAVLGEFDRLPRFAASTFKDWDAFARAYAAVLLPHAKVTPAIRAMAMKLTEDQKSPKEQARLLYEWVRDNVRFIPIPLEESRPEPHDAEQVMTKLYGDAKDQAVLLYALLAARDIAAEIVLLNASDSATIAEPPVMRPMNHLIVYLPRFDIWLDSTTGIAPFGILPLQELGKPAIHLGGSGPARGTIPIPPSTENHAEMKTEATIDANGEVSGNTRTTAGGSFGVWLRGAARSFGESDMDKTSAATMLLRQRGTPGTGAFFFDAPASETQDYSVNGTFHLQNKLSLLHGGFFAPWSGLRILPRIGDVLAGPLLTRDIKATEPTFCFPGKQREEISLTIPAGRELGTLPEDNVIDTDMVHFRSHWALDGRRATVTREFESIAPGPICEGPVRAAMAGVLTKIRADLNNLVGIKIDSIMPNAAGPSTGQDEGQKDQDR